MRGGRTFKSTKLLDQTLHFTDIHFCYLPCTQCSPALANQLHLQGLPNPSQTGKTGATNQLLKQKTQHKNIKNQGQLGRGGHRMCPSYKAITSTLCSSALLRGCSLEGCMWEDSEKCTRAQAASGLSQDFAPVPVLT